MLVEPIKTYRYLVTQPDLNAHGTLHGGILMKWVDESCGMQARLITGRVCATRNINLIDFVSTARLGDIVEVTVVHKETGKTSITFTATVRNAMGGVIAFFDKLTFVAVDKDHKPVSIDEDTV